MCTSKNTQSSVDIIGENPFRFSSEYHDNELGLIYYNYRHYSPTDGRWLSRDPIEEQGGLNLYGFILNCCVNSIDRIGLAEGYPCCSGAWSSFSVFAEFSGDWWLELGSGSISWYGIGAAKVCASIDIGAKGEVECECCLIEHVSEVLKVGPVKNVCLEFEIPWTLAIGAAILVGVPIPGTSVIAMGGIGAFALRTLQRLKRLYQQLDSVLEAKQEFEALIKSDKSFPTKICEGSV